MTMTEYILQMIDNDRPLYDLFLGAAKVEVRHAPRCDQVVSGIWTVAEAERFNLAEQLKDHVTDLLDDIQLKPVNATIGYEESADLLVRQLVQSALSDIDWRKMADHYLTKVAEGA